MAGMAVTAGAVRASGGAGAGAARARQAENGRRVHRLAELASGRGAEPASGGGGAGDAGSGTGLLGPVGRSGAGGGSGTVAGRGAAPGSAPGGRLRHSEDPWSRAAAAADELSAHLGGVKPDFAAAHEGLATATDGLGATRVLAAVRGSWEVRIATAADECGDVAQAMRAAVRDQGAREAATGAAFGGGAAAGLPGGGGTAS
jgi:hypothetical protein